MPRGDERATASPTIASPSGGAPLLVEPARPEDGPLLLALREGRSAWLAERGIQQWKTGEVTVDEVEGQVLAREWHVLRDEGGGLAAAVRLLWQDETFWGTQPPSAAYLHGLMVDRRYAGCRLGLALIAWADVQVRRAGRSLLRLDCAEDNPALRRYYTEQGFRVVGRRDFESRWSSVVLLEKVVERRPPSPTVPAWTISRLST